MKTTALLLGFAALCALGRSQVLGKPVAPVNYGPDIQVPASNIARVGDSAHKRYTHYLIYKGVWRHTSIDDGISPLPVLATHGPFIPLATAPQGYHPSDIRSAYGMPANGGSAAIAIVDAFDDPSLLSDFNVFCAQFGLPKENSTNSTSSTNQVFQVVYAAGAKPSYDNGWAGEESLDVEWAHAVAPAAKIYLVEAAGESDAQLNAAVQVAESLPNVKEVSMSWGATGETTGEQTEDSVYTQPGVVYFSATGDVAANRGYPSMSPNVVAVGGTTLNLLNGSVSSESVWSDSGCGPSAFVARPTYQNGVSNIVGNFRGTPDLCVDADPNTGVAVYNTNDIGQSYNVGGWEVDGGTSLSTPICAAITNVRGNFSATSFAEHTRIYAQLGTTNLRDITSGSITDSSTNPPKVYTAAVGYDLASGLGEPINLYSTATLTGEAETAAPLLGALLGGYVSDLNVPDGVSYVIGSRLQVGYGQVAEAQIALSATPPFGYQLSAAQLQLFTSGIVGATEQIEVLNVTTSQYDVLQTVSLTTGGGTTTVSLNTADYVAANGTVTVRLLAQRPESAGLSAFSFRIDQAVLNGTFTKG